MTDLPRLFRLSRLSAFGRGLVCVEFVLAVGAIVYIGLHLFGDVFAGSPAALPVRFDASCDGVVPTDSCRVSTVALNEGRYRIATDVPAARITLFVDPQSPVERARVLLVRVSQPGALGLRVRAGSGAAPAVADVRLADPGLRTLTALPSSPPVLTTLSFVTEPATVGSPIVLDELGFFDKNEGLVRNARQAFFMIPARAYYTSLMPRAVAGLCAFTVIAALLVPWPIQKRLNPVLLGLLCFAVCLVDLAILFSPYWSRDLRLFYASGPLQEPPGINLNVSLWQGFRLLHGQGLTFAAGTVPWQRMPGYGLFCGLAGLLFGGRTLVDMAIATVLLQVLFYSAALAFFAWAAGLLWPPAAVWTLGLLIALLPKQLGYTQVDSIIAPIVLLVLASLCMRLKATGDGRPVPLALDVLVHVTFALWFLMRPDVVPGWLVVALVLHWRRWRRLLIPLTLFLLIGFGWSAYRAPYSREFTMTTSSAGASLFCGLWEVPSRFALTCSDASYFDWIRGHTALGPQTQAANRFAVREVFKFWLTYPGHFVIMLYHKMMRCLDGDVWPGPVTELQRSFFEVVPRPRVVLPLLTITALCLVTGYERRRTLLLGWPLWLNAPLFWVMFASEGRFYSAVGIALLVVAVPPVFEGQAYRSIAARPWPTLSVLAGAGLFMTTAWRFHDWLLQNDAFHYWTPWLDPARSPLGAFK